MAAAVAVTNPSFIARRKGRGRGLRLAVNLVKPGPPPSQDSTVVLPTKIACEPKTIQEGSKEGNPLVNSTNITSCTLVADIIKKMDNLTESEIMKTILPEIEAVVNDKETIEDLVRSLSVQAISDPSFGVTASRLIAKVWDNKSMHSLIRNPLLKQTQEDYTNRNKLKGNEFYGLCVYVCELFKRLRVKDVPLQPVGNAVVQLLKELMQKKDKPSDEDIFYFYQELESVATIIEDCLPVKLNELVNIARKIVISTSLIPTMRCRFVQLIELHAAKWQMSDELKMMYEDMQQDLMSEGK